jgi:hypothetical protein
MIPSRALGETCWGQWEGAGPFDGPAPVFVCAMSAPRLLQIENAS